MTLMIKGAVILSLFAIILSLGSGLFFLFKDESRSHRTVNALTVRITLSVLLFLAILAGMWSGVIPPSRPL